MHAGVTATRPPGCRKVRRLDVGARMPMFLSYNAAQPKRRRWTARSLAPAAGSSVLQHTLLSSGPEPSHPGLAAQGVEAAALAGVKPQGGVA